MPSPAASPPEHAEPVFRARGLTKVYRMCDEPTGALDSATGVRVLQALERINRETGALTVVITHNAVLCVPVSALFRHRAIEAVFRLDGGRARLTQVRSGLAGEGWIEIRDGLAAGARVIVHPDRELDDDARVQARGT